MAQITIDSPLGPLTLTEAVGRITALRWGRPDRPDADIPPVLAQAADQIGAYFAGTRRAFDLPVACPPGLVGQVMQAMATIPFGETRTYGDLARDLGVPAQAIGQACGANPVPIVIPCHRVLGRSTLGGFSAPGGVETKVALLRHEGAAGLLI